VENASCKKSEGLADLFKPRRTARREHPLACVVLGILRTLRDERFGEQWHCSPEQSIFFARRENGDPGSTGCAQSEATNNDINLLFGTTLYDLKVAEMPAAEALMARDGLRLFSPPAARWYECRNRFFSCIHSRRKW